MPAINSATINVAGPVAVSIKPAGGALMDVGYTEQGVDITEQIFSYDVQGDQNGGDQGPPIDIQYMGAVDIVRMTFTKYNQTTMQIIRDRLSGTSPDTPGTAGVLHFQGTLAYELLLDCFTPRNYTRVVFREPIETNKGTKHSKLTLIATCYKDGSGVLYNTTGSALGTTTTTTTAAP